MAGCDIIPLPSKACSGKCKGGGCTKPTVWVLAACEGKVALFQKHADGHLVALMQGGRCVSSFEDGLRTHLISALDHAQFSQLVLVGGANDISWTQASLPAEVSKQVVAEIKYPLMAQWFSDMPESGQLSKALENIFQI